MTTQFRGDIETAPPVDHVYPEDSHAADDTVYSYPFDEWSPTKEEFEQQVQQLQRTEGQQQRTDVHRCKSDTCEACGKNHVEPIFIPATKVDPSEIRRLPKRWWEDEETTNHGFFDVISNFVCGLLDDVVRCDDDDPNVDSSGITWLAGNPDDCGNLESPTKDTSSVDSDDGSHYVREYHIAFVDEESIPFDEPLSMSGS
jgi:hypothetical protein